MNAALIYDGSKIQLPPGTLKPAPGQLVGTQFDQLGEVACRECYDSFGVDEETGKSRGRTSEKLHSHILDVKNHSVYEHANFTIGFADTHVDKIIRACLNRKGLWIEPLGASEIEVSVNFRSILEWERHTNRTNETVATAVIGEIFKKFTSLLAPQIVPSFELSETAESQINHCTLRPSWELNDDQAWISLWLYGSRGFTHEQVRHRYAISQRSTRYVDEDGSPYIEHPLITKWFADDEIDPHERGYMRNRINESMQADRLTYKSLVGYLTEYCSKSMDKTSARKQARGAARGYLGNALASSMIYSTSVNGWKWILSQRKCVAADAEIRQIYTPALAALKSSQYGDRFASFVEVPSPDGIGTVLAT